MTNTDNNGKSKHLKERLDAARGKLDAARGKLKRKILPFVVTAALPLGTIGIIGAQVGAASYKKNKDIKELTENYKKKNLTFNTINCYTQDVVCSGQQVTNTNELIEFMRQKGFYFTTTTRFSYNDDKSRAREVGSYGATKFYCDAVIPEENGLYCVSKNGDTTQIESYCGWLDICNKDGKTLGAANIHVYNDNLDTKKIVINPDNRENELSSFCRDCRFIEHFDGQYIAEGKAPLSQRLERGDEYSKKIDTIAAGYNFETFR